MRPGIGRMRLIFCVIILVFLPVSAFGSTYIDDFELFSFALPHRWIFQARLSTDYLTVFYGPGEASILYIENLGKQSELVLPDYVQGIIDAYAGLGGLARFEVDSVQDIEVARFPAVSVIYSYQGENKQRLYEKRVFVRVEEWLFTITIGDDAAAFFDTVGVLDEILASWRWLGVD